MSENRRSSTPPTIRFTADECDAVQGVLLAYLSGAVSDKLAGELRSVPADEIQQFLSELGDDAGVGSVVEICILRPATLRKVFRALERFALAHPDAASSDYVLNASTSLLTAIGLQAEAEE